MRSLGLLFLTVLVLAPQSKPKTASWTRHTIDAGSRGADGVRFADANRDGRLDAVTAWEEGGLIRLALQPDATSVRRSWPAVTVGVVRDPEDAVITDLDGDGAADVVSSCEGETRTIYVHWGPGERSRMMDPAAWKTETLPASRGRAQWMYCVPVQLDGRNGVDLVCGAKGPGAEVAWFESPAQPRNLAEWRLHTIAAVGWTMSLIAADRDTDNDIDIVLTDRKGAESGCFWLENPGPDLLHSGGWKRHAIGGLRREVMFASLGGVSGPGEIIATAKPRDVLLFARDALNPRNWNSRIVPFPDRTGTAKGVGVADIDMDGGLDLVISCEDGGKAGSGVFWISLRADGKPPTWEFRDISGQTGVKFDQVEVLDLDGDQDLDVITTEETENLGVIWYENPARRLIQ